jgi:hypothetical protein
MSHGAKHVMMQFEWNNGITQYRTSSEVKRCIRTKPPHIRDSRPCEMMHAFGAPLVPDVNSSR